MKKIVYAISLTALAAVFLGGCSDSLGSVELGEYKGVEVNYPIAEVTDEEVEAEITKELESHSSYVEVDREAANGDMVNIDYVGYQEGVAFAGGTAEGQEIVLGSGTFIDGFEDGLLGARAGDSLSLELSFPEDYSDELFAGEDVTFEVTVNSVNEEQAAVLDDAFVQSISEYATVEEYRQGIRDALYETRYEAAFTQIQQEVLAAVIASSKFKLSGDGVSALYNASIEQYTQQAQAYGMTLTQMASAYGMSEAEFKRYIYAEAEENAKSQLVLDAVAEKEGLTFGEEDLEAFAEWNGLSLDSILSLYGEENTNEMARNFKIMRFMAEAAVNTATE